MKADHSETSPVNPTLKLHGVLVALRDGTDREFFVPQ